MIEYWHVTKELSGWHKYIYRLDFLSQTYSISYSKSKKEDRYTPQELINNWNEHSGEGTLKKLEFYDLIKPNSLIDVNHSFTAEYVKEFLISLVQENNA